MARRRHRSRSGDHGCRRHRVRSHGSRLQRRRGDGDRCHQQATSDLLVGARLDAVLPLGDIQYDSASIARINAVYEPTWGRVKSISRPILGNHEGGGDGYFDYFNGPGVSDGPAGPRGKGYYSFDLGGWHLVALNSNCSRWPARPAPSRRAGCAPTSPRTRPAARSPTGTTPATARGTTAAARPCSRSGRRSGRRRRRARAVGAQPRLRALRAAGPRRCCGPSARHPPVRGRHRRAFFTGVSTLHPAQRGGPERHVRRPEAHASPVELRLAVRPHSRQKLVRLGHRNMSSTGVGAGLDREFRPSASGDLESQDDPQALCPAHDVPLLALRAGPRESHDTAQGPGPLPSRRPIPQAGVSGHNGRRFRGRIASKRLGAGRFRASFVAFDGSGNRSVPQSLGFTIVRRR